MKITERFPEFIIKENKNSASPVSRDGKEFRSTSGKYKSWAVSFRSKQPSRILFTPTLQKLMVDLLLVPNITLLTWEIPDRLNILPPTLLLLSAYHKLTLSHMPKILPALELLYGFLAWRALSISNFTYVWNSTLKLSHLLIYI